MRHFGGVYWCIDTTRVNQDSSITHQESSRHTHFRNTNALLVMTNQNIRNTTQSSLSLSTSLGDTTLALPAGLCVVLS